MPATFEKLSDEYETWLALPENANVPKISADEAICKIQGNTNPSGRSQKLQAQINWLVDFCDRWEKIEG